MSLFMISCGGTGGHLSPGIAVAERLIERGHHCILIVSEKQVDSRLAQNYPELEFVQLPGVGFSLRPRQLFRFVVTQVKALFEALKLIQEHKPDTVIGFGGFISVSVSIVGALVGCPIVLHEANRYVGKAIRFLSALAKRVYLPQGVKLRSLPPKTIRHACYPLRREIRHVSRTHAAQKRGMDPNAKWLLVIGGSQGARALTLWVEEHFEALAEQGINVYCVTGLSYKNKGTLQYKMETGKVAKAIFVPFEDNMSELLSCVDLAISRAGAGSIAEMTHCRLPAIYVPYPYAANKHQQLNARFIEQQGGCVVVEQNELGRLFDEVVDLIYNDWTLARIKTNLGRIDSTYNTGAIIEDIISVSNEARRQAS